MGWQLELGERVGHGGRRRGAGRKRVENGRPRHRRREAFRNGALHVTSRVVRGMASLRRRSVMREIEGSLREGCERGDFRLVHYSIQRDHVHWIVEAADERALGRGMRGLLIRVAKAANRVLGRRGAVFAGRYHAVRIRAPRQARAAIAYVLNNARRHGLGRRAGRDAVDPASSGRWFDGWSRAVEPAHDPPCVAPPRSWLLSTGWWRGGAIEPAEVPAAGGLRFQLVEL